MQQLSDGAVKDICMRKQDKIGRLLQVYNIRHQDSFSSFFMSDGRQCIKTFLVQDDTIQEKVHQFAIIRVQDYYLSKAGDKVGLIKFNISKLFQKLIGVPQLYSDKASNKESKIVQNIPFALGQSRIDQQQINGRMVQATNIKQEQTHNKATKQEIKSNVSSFPSSFADVKKIQDIRVGVMNYSIICKVTDFHYTQGSANPPNCRILILQLTDQSGVIEAVAFQKNAQRIKNIIKQNNVYKITKCNVTANTYKNQTLKVPLKIVLLQDSMIKQVDIQQNIQLNRYRKRYITIEQLQKRASKQQFDVEAVLVKIEKQQEKITEDGRVVFKRNWIMADPVAKMTIDVVVWNDKIVPNHALIGKTVLLNKFQLSLFKGTLSLTCYQQSNIQLALDSKYCHLQQAALSDYKTYQNLSGKQWQQRSTRQLQSAVVSLQQNQQLYSDLTLWISHMRLYNLKRNMSQMMVGIEMADAFGSLHMTAHDRHCRIIFKDQYESFLKQFMSNPAKVQDVFDRFVFGQYQVKIITKKFQDQRIAHILAQIKQVQVQIELSDNLIHIRQQLEGGEKKKKNIVS